MLPPFLRVQSDGRMAIYLDNHLLSTYNECEQKFYYQHIRNLRLKGTQGVPSSGAFAIGIWWSKCLELYYRGMHEYQLKTPGSAEPSEKTLFSAAQEAWNSCGMPEFATKNPKAYDQFGGAEGAIRMCEQYWDRFGELDLKNWNIIAMELSFGYGNEVLLYEDSEILIYWCGTPDLIVHERSEDVLLVVDHKTKDYLKSNFVMTWKPHPQTAGYVKALQIICKDFGWTRSVDRCLINGAARLQAKKPKGEPKPRFLRVRPHYTADEIKEWQIRTIEKAKNLYNSWKQDHWQWRESACHLYAGCPYRGIDSQTPVSREIMINAGYVEIEPWSPAKKQEKDEVEEINAE